MKQRSKRKAKGRATAADEDRVDVAAAPSSKKRLTKKGKKKGKGKDGAQDDSDGDEIVAPTEGEEDVAAAPSSKKRSTKKGKKKGKGKDVAHDDSDGDEIVVPTEGEEDEDNEGGKGAKRGPFPEKVLETALSVYDDCKDELRRLAAENGKTLEALEKAMGLGIQTPRAMSGWNMFQRHWGAEKGNPKKCKSPLQWKARGH